jgi:hypothetical protein
MWDQTSAKLPKAPQRSKIKGKNNSVKAVELISPPVTTMAKGF